MVLAVQATPDSLQAQIEAHESWLMGESTTGRLDWRDETLPSVDLTGLNLSKSILSRSDLRSVILRGTDMSDSNLYQTEFGPDLSGVKFERSQLMHADLSHADLSDAIFVRANLFAASLNGAYLDGADFMEAVCINEAKFAGADLSHANLHRTSIHDVSFRGARLIGADFAGAHCFAVDFTKANLEHADLRKCHFVNCSFSNTH